MTDKISVGLSFTLVGLLTLMVVLAGCSEEAVTPPEALPAAVAFDTYLQESSVQTRATYPATASGAIDTERLKGVGLGVFAQYTGTTQWASYSRSTAFNFMWNQRVTWSDALAGRVTQWTYEPVKYWPNDNQPADDEGAEGSVEHSYLSFFGYAPYQAVADPLAGFDVKDADDDSDGEPDNDGIVGVSNNGTDISASYVYYRTSLSRPFDAEESVDLLWAVPQRDLYKTKDSGEGKTTGTVPLVMKHALTKLEVNVRALIDRTSQYTSPAYKYTLDDGSRIYIDNVNIATPDFYTEGKLMIAPDGDVPVWDYTGQEAKTGFSFGSTGYPADNTLNYEVRCPWTASSHKPAAVAIVDDNGDNLDDETGLTLAETAKAAFDELEEGVTDEEKQLSATYPMFMFPPSTDTGDITVTARYHVVTYDDQLTLNSPKFFSCVTNNITASVGNSDFRFEPNRQYKILLSLGLTSVKFEVYVLDDQGEYILLSAVVKEWDVVTKEANVDG